MPPARVPPAWQVALCGQRDGLVKSEIVDALKKQNLVPACLEADNISALLKDKNDTDKQRWMVFLNCKSKEAATKACRDLNRSQSPDLGIDKYGKVLQAVLKSELKSVDWKALTLTKTATKTVEGAIAKKRNTDCFIDHPMKVWVSQDVFEGTDDVWRKVSASFHS